uniref:Uncharacterized protein n=1 Tax=Rhizophora mucronata TaxID=61149 RepID=A0A2P2QVS2_RHIMU
MQFDSCSQLLKLYVQLGTILSPKLLLNPLAWLQELEEGHGWWLWEICFTCYSLLVFRLSLTTIKILTLTS